MLLPAELAWAHEKRLVNWVELTKDRKRILAKMTVKQAEEIESEHADDEDFDFKQYSQSIEFWKRFK